MNTVTAQLTIVACGGTIESRPAGDGIKEIVGGIEGLAPDLRVIRFRRAPSFSLRLPDFVELARVVRAESRRAPVIVTSGTDTLEDLAFVLDCLAPPAGVVVTGAAIGGSQGEDGPANLRGARLAAGDAARPPHVAVVAFAGVCRGGRGVEESASPPDLFSASAARPLGWWDDAGVHWTRPLDPLALPQPAGPLPSVGIVLAHPGAPPPIAAIEEPDILVVAGYGAGNVPPDAGEGIEQRLAAGRPVVLTSRTPALPVRAVSRDPGGGARLLELGAWNAGGVPARKAALLAALAGTGRGAQERFAAAVRILDEERRP